MVIPKGKLGQGAWSYQKGHKDTGTLLIQKGHDKDKGHVHTKRDIIRTLGMVAKRDIRTRDMVIPKGTC